MADATVNQLLDAAKCIDCYPAPVQQAMQTYIYASIAGESLDPNTLAKAARCLACYDINTLLLAKAYFLLDIAGEFNGWTDALADSKCYDCIPPGMSQSVDTYLTLNDPNSPSNDPAEVARLSRCFMCLEPRTLLEVQVYLLSKLDSKEIGDVIPTIIGPTGGGDGGGMVPPGIIRTVVTRSTEVNENHGGIGGGGPCVFGIAPSITNKLYGTNPEPVAHTLISFTATACPCTPNPEWVLYGTDNADGSGGTEINTSSATVSGDYASDTVVVPIPISSYLYLYVTLRCGAQESAISEVMSQHDPDYAPLAIPGVRVWFDAADSATLLDSIGNPVADGGQVFTWVDKSGNARNAATATATKPLRRAGIKNSKDVVEFGSGGTTGMPSTDDITGTDDISIFAVVYAQTNFLNFRSFVRYQNVDGEFIVDSSVGTNGRRYCLISSDNNSAAVRPSNGIPLGSWSISEVLRKRNTANGLQSFRNGNQVDQYTTLNAALPSRTLSLGYAQYNGTEPFVGYIAEVIIYASSLTSSQREYIEDYLSQKWAITNPDPAAVSSPTSIAGCKVWFDGSDSATLLDSIGNPVAADGDIYTWVDKSGNGSNASQATATKTKRRTSVQNSLDVVEFGVGGAVTGMTSADSINGLDEVSVIIVAKASTTLQNYRSIVRYQNIDGQYLSVPFYSTALFALSSADSNIALLTPRIDATLGAWNIIVATRKRNTTDGLAAYKGSTFYEACNGANTALPNRTLGLGYAQFNGTEQTIGQVGEIIIYNSALTETQIYSVVKYLKAKWGIS